jgi:hypothetical protein
MLIQESPGSVVVLDRQSSTGNAVVLGGLLEQRQGLLQPGAADLADADLDGIGRECAGHCRAERHKADKQPDHACSRG